MNSAEHAGEILQAWRFHDRSGFTTALDSAFVSCTAVRSISRFESECREVLQSVVEHLRTLDNRGEFPDHSKGSGASALLSHLSSGLNHNRQAATHFGASPAKTLKFGTERAKCSTEVECRPRG